MQREILTKALKFALAFVQTCSICFSKLSFASIVTPLTFPHLLFSICAIYLPELISQYLITHGICWYLLVITREDSSKSVINSSMLFSGNVCRIANSMRHWIYLDYSL